MRLGIHFMNFAVPAGTPELGGTISATARTADQAGVAWFTPLASPHSWATVSSPAWPRSGHEA
jgi:hypothetical protein